jgi:hypothetical protein
MKRTTVCLKQGQLDGLAQAAREDPAGLSMVDLIRLFINDGLARRAAKAQKQAA